MRKSIIQKGGTVQYFALITMIHESTNTRYEPKNFVPLDHVFGGELKSESGDWIPPTLDYFYVGTTHDETLGSDGVTQSIRLDNYAEVTLIQYLVKYFYGGNLLNYQDHNSSRLDTNHIFQYVLNGILFHTIQEQRTADEEYLREMKCLHLSKKKSNVL